MLEADPCARAEQIARLTPCWSHFKVAEGGSYLGIHIGKDGENISWRGPLRKYLERMARARDKHGTLQESSIMYALYCLPVLSYVAQFMDLPLDIIKKFRHAIATVIASPFNAMPLPLLLSLNSLGFSCGFPDFAFRSKAVRVRAILDTCQVLHACDAFWEEAVEGNLMPPLALNAPTKEIPSSLLAVWPPVLFVRC